MRLYGRIFSLAAFTHVRQKVHTGETEGKPHNSQVIFGGRAEVPANRWAYFV